MTTKGEIRDLVARILDGSTDAGIEVYTPSDWPTWQNDYPVILVSCPREEKISTGGRGTVEFTVVATIRIVAKVQMKAYRADLGATIAEGILEGLEGQIQRLVINNPTLMRKLSQIPSVESRIAVNAEGEQHLAELALEIGCEFYQGPEDFYDPDGVELTTITVTTAPEVINTSGNPDASLYITLPQPPPETP
jgi:hypothetical protein